MSNILKVENLQALNFEGSPISIPVSFELRQGEVLFLKGENGAGKSTLIKTLLGLHKSYVGQFQFMIGQDKIQYLPQLGNLNFHLPLTLSDMIPREAKDSLLIKGIDLAKKWNTASGGERQKNSLAALLAQKPEILFLDEPFNHVDKTSSSILEQALGLFLKVQPKSSLVIVSHRAFVQDWPTVRFLEIR